MRSDWARTAEWKYDKVHPGLVQEARFTTQPLKLNSPVVTEEPKSIPYNEAPCDH